MTASTTTPVAARWAEVSPLAPGSSAALAVFHVHGDIERAMGALAMTPVGIGEVRLRRFGDFDRGVAARPASDALLLMPHAGAEVRRRMAAWLTSAGIVPARFLDARALYPEAASGIEAHMLHALSHAASPLAIDLLLDQPRRWAGGTPGRSSPELSRLLVPATVVAFGAPNIGKSTLLNALARRAVAVVADEPGTTRDHVGVRLDLAGLVVQYVDTPGVQGAPADDIQRESQEIARNVASGADLVLLCADVRHPFIDPPADASRRLRVGLRADMGNTPGAQVSVCARTGAGLAELVGAVREALVPAREIADPAPWRFWASSEDAVEA
jgi:hypothetical protein